jgi:uncharacterized protein YbjT (DUF2867 family)
MKKVLVIGASGFLGRHVVLGLLQQGYAVRCAARTPEKVKDLAAAGCEVVQGDISDAASMARAVESVDAVYVTVQTLSAQPAGGGQGYMDVEQQGMENIVTACKASGVRRLIYVTFLGITPHSASAWVRGRWALEQWLLRTGLDVTVLRPMQIVGKGGLGFNMMVSNAKRSVAISMANARQLNRNIALDDLVYYMVGVLEEPRSYGHCYDVGCDDLLTNDQMTDVAADLLGRKPPMKLHIPAWLLRVTAPLLERASGASKGAIRAFVDAGEDDATGDPMPIREILPRPLLNYRQAVERALQV